MGKLITIAGNLGSGKTTLSRLLCDYGGFVPYWEKPEERPFQQAFSSDMPRWALANQVDFFLFRCEQERQIRNSDQIAIMDGGLDQDFHVFTHNLHHKGHLSSAEFRLCERLYQLVRSFLPPPDLIIRIMVDTPTLLHRRLNRVRKTVDQSFDPQEFVDLELLLDGWLNGNVSSPVLPFPFEHDLNNTNAEVEVLISQINEALCTSMGRFNDPADVHQKET